MGQHWAQSCYTSAQIRRVFTWTSSSKFLSSRRCTWQCRPSVICKDTNRAQSEQEDPSWYYSQWCWQWPPMLLMSGDDQGPKKLHLCNTAAKTRPSAQDLVSTLDGFLLDSVCVCAHINSCSNCMIKNWIRLPQFALFITFIYCKQSLLFAGEDFRNSALLCPFNICPLKYDTFSQRFYII